MRVLFLFRERIIKSVETILKKIFIKLPREKTLTHYPSSYIFLYNSSTILHFFLGAFALVIGYDFLWFKYLFGLFFLLFAFINMYIIMPLVVCPHCPYFSLEKSLCVSGLNIIANLITTKGNVKCFVKRNEGLVSHNNLIKLSLYLPFILILPAFFINLSIGLIIISFLLIGSIAFRLIYLIPVISCGHCRVKAQCPNAKKLKITST
jgi:hypothetical protein